MADLVTFAGRVQDILCDAYRVRHWTPQEAEQYMDEYADRRQHFEELAQRLNLTIIRPRVEAVASYFVNAKMVDDDRSNCTTWSFEFSDRFPAHTRLEFAIEHDVRFERFIVRAQTQMLPVFIRFNEQDRLLLPLDQVDEAKVADWIEERLLEFLDAYLRLDGGNEQFVEEPATDPVCGMQISRSSAAASDSYHGHPYYFCCTDCRDEFWRDPVQYVQIKTM